uniref:Uncharacterized protein n=1 Tax=Meloidogyne enterolobii TaxID=390850 RepID=A0A6V7VLC0_MELEN|nr:unnamed protein product [Meloidogyne enterolobii]
MFVGLRDNKNVWKNVEGRVKNLAVTVLCHPVQKIVEECLNALVLENLDNINL